jgi:ABC-type transport system substrate-binding protein
MNATSKYNPRSIPFGTWPPALCTAIALVVLMASAQGQPAEAPQRLFEQTPHDQITLKDGSVIQTEPASLPQRQVPQKPKPSDKLRVRLIDRPGEDYEVLWRDIQQVQFFEQMILAEAVRLSSSGDIDGAYDYFDYLERNYPNLPGLEEAMQRYLYQDAQAWQRRGQFDYVLVLLRQLHQRNPKFPNLDRAIALVTEKLIDARLERDDHASAHRLVEQLEKAYPREPAVSRLRQKLTARAGERLAAARQQLAVGQLRAAHDQARAALAIWPALNEARELLTELHSKYPVLVVGVTGPLVAPRDRLDNWPARRARRLLQYELTEYTGPGAEGGVYASPFGAVEKGDLGLRVSFLLRGDMHWPSAAPVTSADIARTLLETAGSDATAPWRELVERVDTPDAQTVHIRLRLAHPHPESLFRAPLLPPADVQPAALLGPFTLGPASDQQVDYLAAAQLPRAPQSPREVSERRFDRAHDALRALERHEIAAIDRLPPWELESARAIPGVTVQRYAAPTVHCLAPNLNKPLLANRAFRRALAFGIHRESILNVQLLRGKELEDAVVATGPLPTGYAHDNAIEPRAYEPRVSMMLASVALLEVAEDQKKLEKAGPTPEETKTDETKPVESTSVQSKPAAPAEPHADSAPPDAPPTADTKNEPKCPPLRLVHPSDEVARLACRTIQRQLALVKIPIELIELPAGQSAPPNDDYDLLYVELQMEEPLVDVFRLFGDDALMPPSSPYLRAALGRLAQATDWRAAREALFEIHEAVATEVSLIPLYQLPEFFVYRRTIAGIGERPASLYQNITAWQTQVDLPEAE